MSLHFNGADSKGPPLPGLCHAWGPLWASPVLLCMGIPKSPVLRASGYLHKGSFVGSSRCRGLAGPADSIGLQVGAEPWRAGPGGHSSSLPNWILLEGSLPLHHLSMWGDCWILRRPAWLGLLSWPRTNLRKREQVWIHRAGPQLAQGHAKAFLSSPPVWRAGAHQLSSCGGFCGEVRMGQRQLRPPPSLLSG